MARYARRLRAVILSRGRAAEIDEQGCRANGSESPERRFSQPAHLQVARRAKSPVRKGGRDAAAQSVRAHYPNRPRQPDIFRGRPFLAPRFSAPPPAFTHPDAQPARHQPSESRPTAVQTQGACRCLGLGACRCRRRCRPSSQGVLVARVGLTSAVLASFRSYLLEYCTGAGTRASTGTRQLREVKQ